MARNENDAIRTKVLQYLYDRNANATSLHGKRGAAVKISEMRADLKKLHALTREQVMSNLNYLISQAWVEVHQQQRVVPTHTGQQIPATTKYYVISASGIDKIEGVSEFTPRDRFAGIQITATGQSTVTVGDGNQVNQKYREEAETLAELCHEIKSTRELTEQQKMDAVADIDAIQSQLSRTRPIPEIVRPALDSLRSLLSNHAVSKLLDVATAKVIHLIT